MCPYSLGITWHTGRRVWCSCLHKNLNSIKFWQDESDLLIAVQLHFHHFLCVTKWGFRELNYPTANPKQLETVVNLKGELSSFPLQQVPLLWQSVNLFDSFVSGLRPHGHFSTGGNPQGVLAALGEPQTMALNNIFHCVISSLLACYCNICPEVECCSCLLGTTFHPFLCSSF